MPPPGPFWVSIGTPYDPVTACDMTVEPSARRTALTTRVAAVADCNEPERAVLAQHPFPALRREGRRVGGECNGNGGECRQDGENEAEPP